MLLLRRPPAHRTSFATELEIDIDPTSGDFGNKSSVLIAVNKTANPVGKYTGIPSILPIPAIAPIRYARALATSR